MSNAPAPVTAAFIASRLGLCSLAWGSSFLLIKLLHGEVSPIVIAAARGLLGGLTLAIWVRSLGQSPLPRREEWLPWLILGTLSGWIPNILVAFALNRMDSGPAALIQASGPLMTAIASHLMFAEEKLTGRRLAGVAIGLAGVALLIGPRALEGGGTTLAVLAMLGVATGYAVSNVYTRTIRNADPARLALGQQAISGTGGLILALIFTGPAGFLPVADHWPTMLALGVFSTALPMAIFMNLIRAAGPTRSAMTGYTVPAVATALGVIVLGERLTAYQIAGGLIVLAGVFLVTTSGRGPTGKPS